MTYVEKLIENPQNIQRIPTNLPNTLSKLQSTLYNLHKQIIRSIPKIVTHKNSITWKHVVLLMPTVSHSLLWSELL